MQGILHDIDAVIGHYHMALHKMVSLSVKSLHKASKY